MSPDETSSYGLSAALTAYMQSMNMCRYYLQAENRIVRDCSWQSWWLAFVPAGVAERDWQFVDQHCATSLRLWSKDDAAGSTAGLTCSMRSLSGSLSRIEYLTVESK